MSFETEDEYTPIDHLADVLRIGLARLGTNDCSTPMGAIELLAGEIRTAGDRISTAILDLASAIREHSA
jgi:hypothetical protein